MSNRERPSGLKDRMKATPRKPNTVKRNRRSVTFHLDNDLADRLDKSFYAHKAKGSQMSRADFREQILWYGLNHLDDFIEKDEWSLETGQDHLGDEQV